VRGLLPKYTVEVCRVEWANGLIDVEADSEEEAKTKALDKSGDLDFGDAHDSEYEVVDIWPGT